MQGPPAPPPCAHRQLRTGRIDRDAVWGVGGGWNVRWGCIAAMPHGPRQADDDAMGVVAVRRRSSWAGCCPPPSARAAVVVVVVVVIVAVSSPPVLAPFLLPRTLWRMLPSGASLCGGRSEAAGGSLLFSSLLK
jgi:hypothetical protein